MSNPQADRAANRETISKCLGLLPEIRKNVNVTPAEYQYALEQMRNLLAQALLGGHITSDEHNAIVGSFDDSRGATVNFGAGAFQVDAPITNNTTLRPILDMTRDKPKQVRYDHQGRVVGIEPVDELA